MHTFLITGATKEKRKEKIDAMLADDHISPFDQRRLILDEDALSLGIAVVRNWQKQLLLMPQTSKYTAGIIESAQLLTTESQNALLKTLEEPPTHAQIYLEATTEYTMLPTILSRCYCIFLGTNSNNQLTEEETTILTSLEAAMKPGTTIGQLLHTVDTLIKTKKDASTWNDQVFVAVRKAKPRLSPHVYATLNKHLLIARKQLGANVSFKLVLDRFFLSLMTRQS